ncbi:uncharacterized protein LOC114355958 [Ostrinia furnacalis]|uniref:uncharacterized protein LOC114355958 n=1 Tax=Ostrinia furnacalis TaxID=93504 RepID=UPI00103E27DB|nr:uncharacterized protein LOC114355958 [Ostrinia furnacalis]
MKFLKIQIRTWIYETNTTCELAEVESTKWKELLEIYTNVLEAFDIYIRVYQIQILYQVLEVFAHALIYVEVFIEFSKLPVEYTVSWLGLLLTIMLLKNLISLTILCFSCDEFYKTIDYTNDFAASMMATDISQEARRFFKNVRRTKTAVFHKMAACGLVCVDAALPLRLSSLVTTYTLVLLQFVFL